MKERSELPQKAKVQLKEGRVNVEMKKIRDKSQGNDPSKSGQVLFRHALPMR